MEFAMIEELLDKCLSLFELWSRKDTAGDLRHLLSYWKKSRASIYTSAQERLDFIQSFNNIKANTLRNEFCEAHPRRASLELFDEVDNLFSRLTHKKKGYEITRVFSKTTFLDEMSQTSLKLRTIYNVAKDLREVPRFYVLCFAFMIAMEGYYDELIRFVYLIDRFVSADEIVDPNRLKYKTVEEIYPQLRIRSVNIVAIWKSGHHVRNAIAHARFTYDESAKCMRFVDVDLQRRKEKFEKSLTYSQLADMYATIDDLSDAMRVLLNMLHVYALLTTPPERIVLVGGPKNK